MASPTIGVADCGQIAPNFVASRTPDHGWTAIGSRQRRSPVGGAANGMPLNTAPPASLVPRTCPPVTFTTGSDCARPVATAAQTSNTAMTARIRFLLVRTSSMPCQILCEEDRGNLPPFPGVQCEVPSSYRYVRYGQFFLGIRPACDPRNVTGSVGAVRG